MKKLIVSLLSVLLVVSVSCTENTRAKTFGGSMTIDLPPKTSLIVATWKESELWYLYQPRPEGQPPKTSVFQEDSNFGLLEGKVVFNEQ